MKYTSSRGKCSSITAAEAIKMGISPDGGLFVPDFIPKITESAWRRMAEQTYQERACEILAYYLQDFSDEDIRNCVNGAYNAQSFDDERIAPLVRIAEGVYIQELWHGPTGAFKDMALQLLPYLLVASAEKTGEEDEIVILVATSGDTGKAALEGFKDIERVKIMVFYPQDGVSEVQKRQMITQTGINVFVAAVEGNFDDAQNGVKKIFADQSFIATLAQHRMKMSSANSINWGRLLPQIVYYVSAYVDLQVSGQLKSGEAINVVVPTGNFGNILAAYYAGQMGVPINRLICASNANNVLTEFIRTGGYDRNRSFAKTLSPSMDILISSNLERLLYEITGHDATAVSNWMEELKKEGKYQVDHATFDKIGSLFWADFSSDEETQQTIRSTWEEDAYLLDTHTAVARNVYDKYVLNTGDKTPTIIASTASPFKFGKSVAEAILKPELIAGQDEFAILKILSEYTGITIPAGIRNLDQRPVLHKKVSSKEAMGETVLEYLKLHR
ncbi:MAG: threonine synthase [Syntrophomonas sp.]|nr:threonine synthase [Syntrophomonas sp.]